MYPGHAEVPCLLGQGTGPRDQEPTYAGEAHPAIANSPRAISPQIDVLDRSVRSKLGLVELDLQCVGKISPGEWDPQSGDRRRHVGTAREGFRTLGHCGGRPPCLNWHTRVLLFRV